MKAAVLHSPGDIRFEDVPTPVPAEDEVLVQIRANGLCGSDIHFFESGQLGPFKVTRPYIPGHEASGTVVEMARMKSRTGSPSATGVDVGTRVVIEPGIPCRRCTYCRQGRYNLCPDVIFLSAPPVNGTFAEYAAVPRDFVHPIPDNVSDEAGAFIEPLSVGIQALTRCGFEAGQTAAV